MRSVSFVGVVLSFTLLGCPGGEPEPSPPTAEPEPASEAPPTPLEPLTAQDRQRLVALGKDFAEAASNADLERTAALWDLDAYWARVTRGLKIQDPEVKASFLKPVRSAGGTGIPDLLGYTLSYRSLREDPALGPLLLFRALHDDGSVLYVECLVGAPASKQPQFVDAYDFTNGEFRAQTTRRLLATSVANEALGPLDDVLREAALQADSQDELLAALRAIRVGDPQQGLDLLRTLPAEVKGLKSTLVLRRSALRMLHDPTEASGPLAKDYRDVLAALVAAAGDDPRAALVRADLHLLDGDFAAYTQELKVLQSVVGDDAYVTYMQAVGLSRAGKHDAAIELGLKAIAEEPDVPELHLGLIELYAPSGRYEELAATLLELEDAYGYEFEFQELKSMQPFLTSEAGQAWLARERAE